MAAAKSPLANSGRHRQPRPDSTVLEVMNLDTSNWTLHAEMKIGGAAEEPLGFTIDGHLTDVLSSTRNISGTWKDSKGRSGPVSISRQPGPYEHQRHGDPVRLRRGESANKTKHREQHRGVPQ
jgi:hypothetical protein